MNEDTLRLTRTCREQNEDSLIKMQIFNGNSLIKELINDGFSIIKM